MANTNAASRMSQDHSSGDRVMGASIERGGCVCACQKGPVGDKLLPQHTCEQDDYQRGGQHALRMIVLLRALPLYACYQLGLKPNDHAVIFLLASTCMMMQG